MLAQLFRVYFHRPGCATLPPVATRDSAGYVAGRRAGVGQLPLIVLCLLCGGLGLVALGWWFMRAARDPQLGQPAQDVSSQSSALSAGIDVSALRIKSWHAVDDLTHALAQFETVFWEPEDTTSLRQWLTNSKRLPGARVLEIGTGTGFISLLCAEHGAERVIATDINPQAVANARYNAELCGWTDKIEVRLVTQGDPSPFAVINGQEQFDLIISNPPWEDAAVEEVAAHALYDPGFALLDGMLQSAENYLQPQGKLLLAYGATTPIQRILATAPPLGWQVQVHDQRDLDSLPAVFVPGVLLELSRVSATEQ